MRTVIQGTIQAVDDPDRLCDWCEERPAVREGVEYRETRLEPAEWLAVCDECVETPL